MQQVTGETVVSLLDYVCFNRIVCGADQYTELRIRHTKGAAQAYMAIAPPST